MQKACLWFCITLLNQSITRKECDSLFVWASAAFGVKWNGWKGAEEYPHVAVRRTVRRHQNELLYGGVAGVELCEPADDDRGDDDSAYESDSSHSPRHQPKGYLQLVKKMTKKFIV
jgi:hypothetical protein